MPGSAFGVCSVSVCDSFAPSDTVTVTVPPSPVLTIGTGAVGVGVPFCVLLPQTRSAPSGFPASAFSHVIGLPDADTLFPFAIASRCCASLMCHSFGLRYATVALMFCVSPAAITADASAVPTFAPSGLYKSTVNVADASAPVLFTASNATTVSPFVRSLSSFGVVTRMFSMRIWSSSSVTSSTGRISPLPEYQREDGCSLRTNTAIVFTPLTICSVASTANGL